MTELRYQRWFLALATPLGLGPNRSDVSIRDDILHVAMGWGFSADIPLDSVKDARVCHDRIFAIGVHGGWRGRWLVNGSPHGIVELTIDPPVRATVMGVTTKLRVLMVSVTDTSELIAACARR
ncbi:MAG: PH domain-containing protein [Actinomycetia bacterium]|nr:PH domain-containing protein [Actinomycetes bacterium]MCH9710976.1 PH domain-containing protein [Actinomycetes bacterium]